MGDVKPSVSRKWGSRFPGFCPATFRLVLEGRTDASVPPSHSLLRGDIDIPHKRCGYDGRSDESGLTLRERGQPLGKERSAGSFEHIKNLL